MTNKGAMVVGLIAIIVIIGGLWFYSNWQKYTPDVYMADQSAENGSTTRTMINTNTGTTSPQIATYTMTQIATHNDATSCYSVISGAVYDLTLWINMHPGGKSAILSICGIDGTEKFMNKHHGAQKQMDILARFKIGLLKS